MTKFNRSTFSVPMGAADISKENWERTFGKKAPKEAPTFDNPAGALNDALSDLPSHSTTGGGAPELFGANLAAPVKKVDPPDAPAPLLIGGVWIRNRTVSVPEPRYTGDTRTTTRTHLQVLVERHTNDRKEWCIVYTLDLPFIPFIDVSDIVRAIDILKQPEDKL
ncbi:MAG: hypothetical protein KA310_03390 [Pseudomonadales bacterium]|nr:hypothetical protein [Pseudomonadales bacterium]